MRITILLLSAIVLLTACQSSQNHEITKDSCINRYASLLSLSQTKEGYTLAQIRNPWQPEEVMLQYLLVPTDDKRWNDKLAEDVTQETGPFTLLRTPLKRLTITSASHTWLLGQLSALDHIAVICDTAYIMDEDIRTWMRNVSITDGGSSMNPNAEVLYAAHTDGVWISPYENQNVQLSAPVICCADYMENSPLGRAEWMRFYGRLVDRAALADSLFADVVTRYDSLSASTHRDSTTHVPTLLAELPYGPTWYVPGGCSTASMLYHDAGYDYFWANDPHTGSLSLSPEAVLAKAADCDRWIIKYHNQEGDWTLSDFVQQSPIYGQFKAAKEGEIWGCNTAYSNFFDVTPFRPDLLLESLINDDQRWFRRLTITNDSSND